MAIAISDYNKIVGVDERIKTASARNTLTYSTIETICKNINFNQMFNGVSNQMATSTHIAVAPVPMTSHIKSISISYTSNVGAYNPGGSSVATGQAQGQKTYTVSAYVLPGVDAIRSNEHYAQLGRKYATAAAEDGAMNFSGIVLAQGEPITIFARKTILTTAGNAVSVGSPISITPMSDGLPMVNNTLRQQVLRLYKAQNGQWSNVPVYAHSHNVSVPNAYLSKGIFEEVKKADIGMVCLQITSSGAAENIFNVNGNNALCPIITIEYIKGTTQSATPSYPGFTSVEAY